MSELSSTNTQKSEFLSGLHSFLGRIVTSAIGSFIGIAIFATPIISALKEGGL